MSRFQPAATSAGFIVSLDSPVLDWLARHRPSRFLQQLRMFCAKSALRAIPCLQSATKTARQDLSLALTASLHLPVLPHRILFGLSNAVHKVYGELDCVFVSVE